MEATSRN